MTKIYTKTGDDGSTGLFGGPRVAKDAERIDAYGDVDELNSAIGLARSFGLESRHDDVAGQIQHTLFVLGADLATPRSEGREHAQALRVTSHDVVCLERVIDDLEADLPPLKHFILPGGTSAAAALHLARTICRRAERRVVRLARTEPLGVEPQQYLNRLSDLLFVLARSVNHVAGTDETKWTPRG